MFILDAQHLTCEKSDRRLFSDLSLSLSAAQLLYLTGDNGAGKTSLLRILVGLSQPNAGTVLIDGLDIHKEQNIASDKLLYLGHKLGVSHTLSAFDNLRFWSAQQGISLSQNSILDVLDELELTGLEDIPVKHLSAGQQRKVCLAKLWIKPNCKLWVLDEPFTALDSHMVSKVQAKIDDFISKQGAVLMTSHQELISQHSISELRLAYQW